MSNKSENQKPTIQVDIEFLDHTFKHEVNKDIDLEELFEIIEKFIIENPTISIDLKSLSKTLLDTEYYNLILKQNDTLITNFDEITIGIPIRLEIESDAVKKRYFMKKHLKSTLRHLNSISINEFVNMFQISNIAQFKQGLLTLESEYPIKVVNDIFYVNETLNPTQLRGIASKLLDFMN